MYFRRFWRNTKKLCFVWKTQINIHLNWRAPWGCKLHAKGVMVCNVWLKSHKDLVCVSASLFLVLSLSPFQLRMVHAMSYRNSFSHGLCSCGLEAVLPTLGGNSYTSSPILFLWRKTFKWIDSGWCETRHLLDAIFPQSDGRTHPSQPSRPTRRKVGRWQRGISAIRFRFWWFFTCI